LDTGGKAVSTTDTATKPMSMSDTYKVEQLAFGMLWLRCRRCGCIWDATERSFGRSWRCPDEPHHGD
jgi:hypothetical protein